MAKKMIILKKTPVEESYIEDVPEQIEDNEIDARYYPSNRTEKLQRTLDRSRKRGYDKEDLEDLNPMLRYYTRNRCNIREFIDASVDGEPELTLYPFSYPDDYLWSEDMEALIYESPCSGYRGNDTLHQEECDNCHITIEEVDIDVEVDASFLDVLDDIREYISKYEGKHTYISDMDVVLSIPFSQMSRHKDFELRMVEFLIDEEIEPRVCVVVRKENDDIDERAYVRANIIGFRGVEH